MEVQKHPHHVTHKKKWFEYFLEFLMIFFAVFLGFLAENIREHSVEKKHENEYMLSLVRDLKRDTMDINRVLKDITSNMAKADTFINLFRNGDFKNTSGLIYYHGWALRFRNLWRANDGTIQQLNYAGGLRVIENKMIVDSIQQYINSVRDLTQILNLEDLEIAEYRKTLGKIFSGFVFDEMTKTEDGLISYNPDLISYDRKDINDIIVQAIIVKRNWQSQVIIMKDLLGKATSLINIIKQEYNIK